MAENYELLQPGDLDGFRQRHTQRQGLHERRVIDLTRFAGAPKS